MRRRLFRVLSAYLQKALELAIRAAVVTLVLGVSLVSLLHHFGIPLPSAHDLLNGFEGLSRIAKIFHRGQS
jgi:hypothetical protein